MVSEIGLLLQSGIATTFCNFKSDSRDGVSTIKRTEGWTEVFGSNEKRKDDHDDDDDDDEKKEASEKKEEEEECCCCWKLEEEESKKIIMMSQEERAVSIISSNPNDDDSPYYYSPSSSLLITIFQYRPAWLEQLVLRICGIPHIVMNSSFSSTESTGRLPFLRINNNANNNKPPPPPKQQQNHQQKLLFPILVGRRQPRLRGKMEGIPGVDNNNPDNDHDNNNNNISASSSSTSTVNMINNDILGYLKSEMGIDLDELVIKELRLELGGDNDDDGSAAAAAAGAAIQTFQSRSIVLIHLITTKLQQSLMVLRYEDNDAWEQIYRKQCIDCSRGRGSGSGRCNNAAAEGGGGGGGNSSNLLPTFRGLFQAWSERVLERKLLWSQQHHFSNSNNNNTPSLVEEAKGVARKCYEILEQQLKERDHNDNNNTTTTARFLLNTKQPALVDAILWDHLAEALCDVHLVVLLADFPLLVQYFQRIHKLYFATTTTMSTTTSGGGGGGVSNNPTTSSSSSSSSSSLLLEEEWKVWNQYQNQRNAFQQIPLLGNQQQQQHQRQRDNNTTTTNDPPKQNQQQFQHALELMQTMSIRDDNLLEVLKIGKAARQRQQQQRPSQQQQREKKQDTTTTNDKKDERLSAIEIARREHERSDQYWISLVIGAAILVGVSVMKSGEE